MFARKFSVAMAAMLCAGMVMAQSDSAQDSMTDTQNDNTNMGTTQDRQNGAQNGNRTGTGANMGGSGGGMMMNTMTLPMRPTATMYSNRADDQWAWAQYHHNRSQYFMGMANQARSHSQWLRDNNMADRAATYDEIARMRERQAMNDRYASMFARDNAVTLDMENRSRYMFNNTMDTDTTYMTSSEAIMGNHPVIVRRTTITQTNNGYEWTTTGRAYGMGMGMGTDVTGSYGQTGVDNNMEGNRMMEGPGAEGVREGRIPTWDVPRKRTMKMIPEFTSQEYWNEHLRGVELDSWSRNDPNGYRNDEWDRFFVYPTLLNRPGQK